MFLAAGGPPGLPPGDAGLGPLPAPGDHHPCHGQRPQPAGDAPPHQPQGEFFFYLVTKSTKVKVEGTERARKAPIQGISFTGIKRTCLQKLNLSM